MGLQGTWYNELGSRIVLEVNGSNVTGTYETVVGEASGVYHLVGVVDNSPNGRVQAVAFVVVWVNDDSGNSHSVTSWSGQYQFSGQEEIITTIWNMSLESEYGHECLSSLTGHNVFSRVKPLVSDVEKSDHYRFPYPQKVLNLL